MTQNVSRRLAVWAAAEKVSNGSSYPLRDRSRALDQCEIDRGPESVPAALGNVFILEQMHLLYLRDALLESPP